MRMDKKHRVELGLEILKNFRYTESNTKLLDKNMAAIEHFLNFSDEECKLAYQKARRGKETMTLTELIKEDGRKEGRKEGHKNGLKKGRLESKREAARRMLAKGYPAEDVVEITGLSREEIEGLKD